MQLALHLLKTYGYWVIFLSVLLDFLGAPITTMPLLVVAGALAAAGKMSIASIALLAALAAILADTLWYGLGRIRGQKILGAMCRLSRNKQRCLTRSTAFGTKYGAASLLVAKFIPGVATVAPPTAGAVGMPLSKFLLLAATGNLLWAGAFSGAGYVLNRKAHALVGFMSQSGYWSLIALVALVGMVFLLVLQQRYSFLRNRPLSGGMDMQSNRCSASLRHLSQ